MTHGLFSTNGWMNQVYQASLLSLFQLFIQPDQPWHWLYSYVLWVASTCVYMCVQVCTHRHERGQQVPSSITLPYFLVTCSPTEAGACGFGVRWQEATPRRAPSFPKHRSWQEHTPAQQTEPFPQTLYLRVYSPIQTARCLLILVRCETG